MKWTLRLALVLTLGCCAGCGAGSGAQATPIVETPLIVCELGPEDVDGFEDEDGCADLDDDHDDIADASDACPCFAEDMDGFEDGDGCPDVDNDQDRNLDACDDCPNVAEIYNGTCDADGCPDLGNVVLIDERIALLEQISFAARDATVATSQRPIVDAVVATLNGNPQVLEVAVVGHATRREGLSLAEERARVVREAMIAGGVDEARLSARGEIAAGHHEVTFEVVRDTETPGVSAADASSYRTECPPEPETWCTVPPPVSVSPSCSAERGAPSPR